MGGLLHKVSTLLKWDTEAEGVFITLTPCVTQLCLQQSGMDPALTCGEEEKEEKGEMNSHKHFPCMNLPNFLPAHCQTWFGLVYDGFV